VLLADPRHEAGGPPDLLRRVDLLAGAGLHTSDVDDVGALGDHPADPLERPLLLPGRPAVVEGVPRAVDDGHHQQVVVGELPASQLQHTGDPRPRRERPSARRLDALGRELSNPSNPDRSFR
jgi:hypothetical protein